MSIESIALPLSVAVDSACELLDFDLDGISVPCEEITERLNKALVSGVVVRKTYETGRKLRDLALLDCKVAMEYDRGVPEGAEAAIRELFAREALTVTKKTKNGMQDQDIIPMIRNLDVVQAEPGILHLNARICCQNPTLNPAQMVAAIQLYLPEFSPDFTKCSRMEILDAQEDIFR